MTSEDLVNDALAALAGPRHNRESAQVMAPRAAGLYAFYGDDQAWHDLDLTPALDDQPLYVGKAERSRDGVGRITITAATFRAAGAAGRRRADVRGTTLMVEGSVSGVEVGKDETVTVRFGQYLPLVEAGYGSGRLEPGVVVRGRAKGQ